MNAMFRFVISFLFLLFASQTWGISVTQHQYDVGNFISDVDRYVYDTAVNLRICDNQCIRHQSQYSIKGHFLAFANDFIATKSGTTVIGRVKDLQYLR